MRQRGWMLVVAAVLLAACGGKDDKPAEAKATAVASKADDDDAPKAGSRGVTLKKADQAKAGIRTEELELQSVASETVAYGRLEEDPSFGFVVRAPYSGILRASTWAGLGQQLAAGTLLGTLEGRMTLPERLSINSQLASARTELNAATEAQKAAQAALNRATALNADNKNVSDRVVEEAAARVAGEKVRMAGAQTLIQSLENTSEVRQIRLERGGEVLEVLAQPGESVEQGAPLLRLGQPEHLLARIEIPVGERVPGNGEVRIVPAGHEAQPAIAATRVALGAASAQGVALLYRLAHGAPDLRPGIAVTAHLPQAGGAGKSLVIPRTAVVQQEGRAWVYVQVSDERFDRRSVPLDRPAGNGYVVTRGFADGDKVVVTGAQTLLSEEFKSSNEADSN